MNIDILQTLLQSHGIYVTEKLENNKSVEKYVRTKFVQDDGFEFNTVIPYYSRPGYSWGRSRSNIRDIAEVRRRHSSWITPRSFSISSCSSTAI